MHDVKKSDFSGLEFQVESLLSNVCQLRRENNALRNELFRAERELLHFKNKNRHATETIHNIITHLKDNLA